MHQLTSRVVLSVLGLVAGLFLAIGPAAAETQTCQFMISAPGITSSTITISQQGVHCLMTDVASSLSRQRAGRA